MIFEENYNGFKEFFDRMMERYSSKTGGDAEEDWLMDQPDAEYDERERFLVFLPLVKYEIEHKFLTRWALNEFEAYYDAYVSGEFEGRLGDDEIDDVEKDLFWCYEHRYDHPIEEGPGESFYKLYGMKPKLNTTISFTNGQYHTLKPVMPDLDELFEKNDLFALIDTIERVASKRTDNDLPSRQTLEGIASAIFQHNRWHKQSR